jgi:outer membrane protein assembly factor BamD (BamD/ComL family)
MPAPTRRWGAVIPAAFLLACIGARLATLRPARVDPMPLYESASRAYGDGRFADAAEYARHALSLSALGPLRSELLCLRGESLLRSGQARLAAQSFQDVLAQPEPNPYVAQALFGVMQARAADGDAEHARAARDQLLRDFATSPWARRALQPPAAPGAAPPG